MVPKVLALLALLAVCSAEKGQSRWSRQISSYTSDISDWVPLTVPVERELPQIRRQAIAEPRILSEPFPGFVKPTGFSQETFPSRGFYNSPTNRQLYLQSVPSAPQNYLSDQGFGQGLRFGLTQPNFPLSQGFVGPQFSFDNIQQVKPRPQIQVNPIKFENSPPKGDPNVISPVNSYINQGVKTKPETPKFVDGYRAENSSNFNFAKKTQPLQKIRHENTDKSKETFGTPKTKVEREEVQLLYVPLESLNRGQFNFRSPITSAQLLNTELYNPRPNPLMQNLAAEIQSPIVQPMDTFNSQEFLTNFNSQLHEFDRSTKFSTLTTPFPTTSTTTLKPKKLKPHQPPLAIFLTHEAKTDNQVKVGDVLHSLKNANTVAVLDAVNPLNSPKVFIGPSSLTPPENYVKFELPYLSNIDNIDKKLRQLPFFVAPLSYKTPQGFAKIPFPSPHVGSVVINSLIKDTSSANKPAIVDTYSNFFSRPPLYKQDQKKSTEKPVVSYYSTSSPKINSPSYEQNYYSIEPQSVSTLRPLKDSERSSPVTQLPSYKTGSYFFSNPVSQYNPSQFVNFPQDTNYKAPEPAKNQNMYKPETTTTPRTTVTTTTKLPSTYPNQLLETHNPYSINQAFHFSTPLDYHNFFDEYKEQYVNPGLNISPSPPTTTLSTTSVSTTKKAEPEQPKVTHQVQQSSPNYLQNYTPEIHYESEIQNSRYPVFNKNEYYTKTAPVTQTEYSQSGNLDDSDNKSQTIANTNLAQEYSNLQTQFPISDNVTSEQNLPDTSVDNVQTTKMSSEYNQYDTSYNSKEILSSTSSSTTTTTRRSPIRPRGRPRYPTVKPDSHEYSTRATITRRPLRERRPLPTRSRHEPNKITTETPIRKPYDTSESTTKPTRTRTRGRIHYKPSESDDNYSKRNKPNSKESDLAYQRDILHQNYPVTLMERTSTVDIEAITEPSEKMISINNLEIFKADTEDAYSNDKLSITEPIKSELKDLPQQYTTVIQSVTEAPYEPNISNHDREYGYEPNSSLAPHDTVPSYDEVREENYYIQTAPEQNTETQEISLATKPSNLETETTVFYSSNDEFKTNKQEVAVTDVPEIELDTKILSQELSQEDENIVETTPSYNRVRIRPGVIRQYHQVSSTETARAERRKPPQAITYRPAFDRRRTTMRIEEIEADLKTKQVHVRPEFQDYKQPVYKPEPSTESSAPSLTTEAATKRNQIRRRRPSYVSTSTEGTVTRRAYDVKNRFRGRRPTEKPTDKPEMQTDISSTTVKTNVHSRFSHRPRLSERYNKKPDSEDQVPEDQDSNYSINRPKYAAPDTERWSPKISLDSFKPYNPNNIADDTKIDASNTKSKSDDIITARNEYDDILISVTPAYNNRDNKKIPEIPPTLEALVEQSKITKTDATDTMSTFESMLEEVMKSLEEQDENEYTSNVMKHKGGEIGEIPPERIISSGENNSLKPTTPLQEETTTPLSDYVPSANNTKNVPRRKNRRRGFWKKVKVRPVSEGFDVAESQYYPRVVNRLGHYVPKNSFENSGKGNSKAAVTTYKPNYQFLKDFFETDEEALDAIPNIDIPKVTNKFYNSAKPDVLKETIVTTTEAEIKVATETVNPGDMDLGTGTPDPTFDDNTYYSEPTQPTTNGLTNVDRSDGFSFMDYLFGVTSPDITEPLIKNITKTNKFVENTTQLPKDNKIEEDTETMKIKATTETSYVPDEITADTFNGNNESVTETSTEHNVIKETKKLTDKIVEKIESSSISSYMDPANVVSTSMSTEVSHETEICFRGKCIKTNKNIL